MASLENLVSKKIGRAIFQHKMIEHNDKILVAVSGGKDSAALLIDLVKRQPSFPIKYTLLAAHIETDFCACCRKGELEDFFKGLPVDYVIKKIAVKKRLKPGKKMNCYWCSTQRRIELLKLAGEYGCNKVALGHHLDDIVETLLMNICFKSHIAGMLPVLKYDKYGGTIIRPMALVPERHIIKLAKERNFKNVICRCPYGQNSNRLSIRSAIKELAKKDKNIRTSIFKSMHNVNLRFLLNDHESGYIN